MSKKAKKEGRTILIANVGSTSLKYQVLKLPEETCLAKGRLEGIGQGDGIWTHGESSIILALPDYGTAIGLMMEKLAKLGILDGLDAVGFKAVIAKGFSGCVELTEDVIAGMEAYELLAPVHTPPYVQAIRAFMKRMPNVRLVGLFEPAFHKDVPDYAKTYPVPERWRKDHGVQRYGYHGASHRYVAEKVTQVYMPDTKGRRVISCHLGGSSSVCAIKNGRSIDTSMGFSPQSGLPHATRHGELDPFAVLYVMREDKLSIDETVHQLTKESGLAGLSGISSGDMKEIIEAMKAGNDKARLAFQTFCYEAKKQIGAYIAALGGLDVLVFTGGIGERSALVRWKICEEMKALGIVLDTSSNYRHVNCEEVSSIAALEASVAIWVVPANEELIVARATYEFLTQ